MDSSRNLLRACLAAAAAGALALLIAAWLSGLAGGEIGIAEILGFAALAVMAASLWLALGLIGHTFDDIGRLQGAITGMIGMDAPQLSAPPEDAQGETAELRRALARLLADTGSGGTRNEQRLEAIIAALPFPLIAATETGLVSLLNAAARGWVLGHRLTLGVSLFSLFDRESWHGLVGAIAPGQVADIALRTVEGEQVAAHVARLAEPGGVVLTLPGMATQVGGALEHALALHERPPRAPAPQPGTSIAELPLVVLDCETTGLDVETDRVIQLSAVRAHGLRVYTTFAIDLLIDPRRPIPPAVTRLTGIDAAMLRDAMPFARAWPQIRDFIGDAIVVGHNVDFDLAMLAREVARAGLEWQSLPSLCTLQLVAALEPKWTDLNLETVAHSLGVDVTGRHTALGDALVTAAIYTRLASRAQQGGATDFAGLKALAGQAVKVIRKQRAAGW